MPKYSINDVLKLLPHRYPMLLIDRVLECEPGEYVRAIKNVSVNEPCFQGHFPERPLFPGVLVIEALAQAAAILTFDTNGMTPENDKLYLFAGIDEARFRRVVEPGDQLTLWVKFVKQRRNIWQFDAQATVDDALACNAKIMVAVRDIDV